MPELSIREQEDIKKMYKDFGWTIRDLSEDYRVSMSDIKSVLGIEKSSEKSNPDSQLQERETLIEGLNKLRERHETTINSFRKDGCAIARCPQCSEIMNNAEVNVSEAGGLTFYYKCDKCGFIDYSDRTCADKCCRRGLVNVVAMRYGGELNKWTGVYAILNNYVNTGDK